MIWQLDFTLILDGETKYKKMIKHFYKSGSYSGYTIHVGKNAHMQQNKYKTQKFSG